MEAIDTALQEARLLLAESGVADAQLPVRKQRAAGTSLLPAIPESSAAQAVDRRGFFRDLIGSVARSTDQIRVAGTPADPADSSRRRNVQPIERLRVVASLARIAARHARQVPARVVPQLSLGQCDAHGVCAVVCPTGALRQQATSEEGIVALQFNSALCIACGQCARVCPDSALRLTPEGGTLADEALARWNAHACEDCGESFFGTANALCPDCIKKVNLQQGMAALFRPFA
jgi:ferredoxin